ncbi:MAG: carboxymuconolactone decarboxylase family protein [Candidatus Eisenbacteria bacterium]
MSRREFASAARALRAARAVRVPRRAAEECALMLVLYAGYPGALEGLRVLHDTWPGRTRARDVGAPSAWRTKGKRLCARIYGPAYPKLVAAVGTLHPDLATWMIEHGYGRVLARGGLTVRARELVTVSALAALGWERQLVSHVLGARRVGASIAVVGEALRIGAAHGDATAQAVAARTWDRAGRTGALAGTPRVASAKPAPRRKSLHPNATGH